MTESIRAQFLKWLLYALLITVAAPIDGLAQNAPAPESSAADSITKSKPANFERAVFWLGLVSGIGLILPLPICLYYFRRIKALTSEIELLQEEIREKEALRVRAEALQARNEKAETETRQIQDKLRAALRSAEEKHKDYVEKMKFQVKALEQENKRLSGLIMIKEQAKKKF